MFIKKPSLLREIKGVHDHIRYSRWRSLLKWNAAVQAAVLFRRMITVGTAVGSVEKHFEKRPVAVVHLEKRCFHRIIRKKDAGFAVGFHRIGGLKQPDVVTAHSHLFAQ